MRILLSQSDELLKNPFDVMKKRIWKWMEIAWNSKTPSPTPFPGSDSHRNPTISSFRHGIRSLSLSPPSLYFFLPISEAIFVKSKIFFLICRCLDYTMWTVLSFDWKFHQRLHFSAAASRKRPSHLVSVLIAVLEGLDHSFIPIESLITICMIIIRSLNVEF